MRTAYAEKIMMKKQEKITEEKLRLDHVTFTYPGSASPLFEDFSLDIPVREGEVCLLRAESGWGKTTVLRLLMGLEKPGKGQVFTGKAAFLFQEDRLIGDLPAQAQVEAVLGSPARGMAFFKHTEKRPSSEGTSGKGLSAEGSSNYSSPVSEAARDALKLVGLDGWEDAPVSSLSGGMKRRVALARTLAFARQKQRRLLLLDEPFTGVDAERQTRIMDRIRQMGFMVVMAGHDELSLRLADRVLNLQSSASHPSEGSGSSGCCGREISSRPQGPDKRVLH